MAKRRCYQPAKILLAIGFLMLLNTSCSLFFKSSEERYMRKQRRVMERQARKDFREQKKKHWEMQSDGTQQMMKNTKKMSRKNNTVRKKGFLRSLKKCDKKGIDN